MIGFAAMIPWRVKLVAAVAVAFMFGLLKWRSAAVDRALEDLRQEQETRRMNAVLEAQEVKKDVETLDDVGLGRRAARWLRDGSPD